MVTALLILITALCAFGLGVVYARSLERPVIVLQRASDEWTQRGLVRERHALNSFQVSELYDQRDALKRHNATLIELLHDQHLDEAQPSLRVVRG